MLYCACGCCVLMAMHSPTGSVSAVSDRKGKGKAKPKTSANSEVKTEPKRPSASSSGRGAASSSAGPSSLSRAGPSSSRTEPSTSAWGPPAALAMEQIRRFLDGVPIDVERVADVLLRSGVRGAEHLRFLHTTGRADAFVEQLRSLNILEKQALLTAFARLGSKQV